MSSPRNRRRLGHATALIVVVGLGLAACSNSSDDSSADSSEATTATTEAVEPESSDVEGTDTVPADTVAPHRHRRDHRHGRASETSEPEADAGPDLGEFQPISGVPGVTDEAIQFAVLGTGPSNPAGYCLLECYSGGVQAYFDYRNSSAVFTDANSRSRMRLMTNSPTLRSKLLELIGSDDVFGTFFAPLIPSGHEDANAARMPIYTLVQGGPEGAGFDNVYIPAIFCADCLRKSAVHQAELVGATKVASLGLGVSQASKDCVAATEKAFDQWGPDVGIEFVYANDTLPFGLTNGLAPEVTAMKEAGVDFITLCIDQNGALTLEQELNRQGMADVPVLLPQGYADTEFVEANAELLEGDVLSLFSRPFEANQEGTLVPEMIEWIDAGGYKMNDQAIQGWVNADMAVTGSARRGARIRP